MASLTRLAEGLANELEPLGYVRESSRIAFVLVELDRRRVVGVQHWLDRMAFSVQLSDMASVNMQRHIMLEEFGGAMAYAYRDVGVAASVEQALADMRRYGMPWLEGAEVTTPALQQRSQIAAQFRGERLRDEGVQAFRRGEYRAAVAALQAAKTMTPLGLAGEKMLELARARALSEPGE